MRYSVVLLKGTAPVTSCSTPNGSDYGHCVLYQVNFKRSSIKKLRPLRLIYLNPKICPEWCSLPFLNHYGWSIYTICIINIVNAPVNLPPKFNTCTKPHLRLSEPDALKECRAALKHFFFFSERSNHEK